MTLWIVIALMTGAAVAVVHRGLTAGPAAARAGDPDAVPYRAQVAEIDRDVTRGVLSAAEADAARAEAARRLLRACADRLRPEADLVSEPALRRRRAAVAFSLSTVPLVALAVYGAVGSPELPGQPLAARLEADAQKIDLASAVVRIETHLAAHPDDGRGWEVVAPAYVRTGRIRDGVRAYEAALRLLGENGWRLANYGEAMVTENDGVVPAVARAAFERALTFEPVPKALYYLALAAEQDGDRDAAQARYTQILSAAPPDAPWIPLVRERLVRLAGADTLAAAPAPERQQAILGMVEGLASRLDRSGGTSDEWSRLIRSYVVLGERDKAMSALDKARGSLAQDPAARGQVEAMARNLGLEAGAARR